MRQVSALNQGRSHRIMPAVAVALGAVAAAYGLYRAPDRTCASLLINGFYGISLGVAGMLFLASQRLSGARWSAGLRRIPEALLPAMPAFGVLLLALFAGREWLYPWSRPDAFAHAPAIAGRIQYLQVPFVAGRMLAAVLVLSVFAWLFRRLSIDQDRKPESSLLYHQRLNRCAGAFVVVFAIAFTTAGYDWILSLDPTWFSTMFAFYLFSGTFVQGIAAITLAIVVFTQRGLLKDVVSEERLHDLGKMLFAFSLLWAYLWTCQYLLIWYANIPEEVTHYVTRTGTPWAALFYLNLCVNWVIPFGILLSVRAKRDPRKLKVVSILLLCGHWLDLYLLIEPSVIGHPRIGAGEILIAAGCASLLYSIFARGIGAAPLVPVNDPVLAFESDHSAYAGAIEI